MNFATKSKINWASDNFFFLIKEKLSECLHADGSDSVHTENLIMRIRGEL